MVIILSIRSGSITLHPKSFFIDPAPRINSRAWKAFKALQGVIRSPLSNLALLPTHQGLMSLLLFFC